MKYVILGVTAVLALIVAGHIVTTVVAAICQLIAYV